jgi:hypothetical protein
MKNSLEFIPKKVLSIIFKANKKISNPLVETSITPYIFSDIKKIDTL